VSGARLSIFLGKGGVGRTTLASAFAVDRAAAGERVLLACVLDEDNPTSRIHHEAAGIDTRGRLELLNLDARALVDGLVKRVTRLGALGDYVVRHPGYEGLIDIVPGVRELAILHTLAQKRGEGYDRIVLDPPATGHGIHFLEAPEKAARILAGPLKARAEELRDLLHDPAVTDVVIVTLPEEMPVRETLELAASLRRQGFPLDNVAVNKWLPRVFVEEGSRRALDALGDAAPPEIAPWMPALRLVAAQRAEAQGYLAQLRALAPVKLAVVPYIAESSRRLLRVAEAMHAAPEVFA